MSIYSAAMTDCQRRSPRHRTVLLAKLKIKGRSFKCVVRDLSLGGAKLRVPAGLRLAGSVAITAPSLGYERAAQVVWQDGSSVGVAFEGACTDRSDYQDLSGSAEAARAVRIFSRRLFANVSEQASP